MDYVKPLIGVLQYLFPEERRLNSTFERRVEEQVKMIPGELMEPINDGLAIVSTILKCIDYEKLSVMIKQFSTRDMDFRALALGYVSTFKEIRTRSYLKSLIDTLDPIFDCLSKFVGDLEKYSHKLHLLLSSETDVLGGFLH